MEPPDVPSWIPHSTLVSALPLTVGANPCCAPGTMDKLFGLIEIVTVLIIVIVALEAFVESDELVAVTVAEVRLGKSSGAVYKPVLLIVPGPVRLHVTPETFTRNCCVLDKETRAVDGVTVTEPFAP